MEQIVNPIWSKSRRRELRERQTLAEDFLWRTLRNRRCGEIKFRRQVGLGSYIADFYAHDYKLVVELDGSGHDSPEAQEYDKARTHYFKELGISVIRFKNSQLLQDDKFVSQAILDWVRTRFQPSKSPPSPT